MSDWHQALPTRLIDSLPRHERLDALHRMDLPRYREVVLPASTDETALAQTLQDDVSPGPFYVTFSTQHESGRRSQTFLDLLDADEVIRCVRTFGGHNDGTIRVSQFRTNRAGGTVIIRDQRAIVELAEGPQIGVAYGTAPTFTVNASLEPDVFECSIDTFPCTHTQIAARVINELRSTRTSGSSCPEGYYEFAVLNDEDDDFPQGLVFFDAAPLRPSDASALSIGHGTLHEVEATFSSTEVLRFTLCASEGLGVGRLVTIAGLDHFAETAEPYILVAETIAPPDAVHVAECAGLILMRGGVTSHPATVARELGVPCVLGPLRSGLPVVDLAEVLDSFPRGATMMLNATNRVLSSAHSTQSDSNRS